MAMSPCFLNTAGPSRTNRCSYISLIRHSSTNRAIWSNSLKLVQLSSALRRKSQSTSCQISNSESAFRLSVISVVPMQPSSKICVKYVKKQLDSARLKDGGQSCILFVTTIIQMSRQAAAYSLVSQMISEKVISVKICITSQIIIGFLPAQYTLSKRKRKGTILTWLTRSTSILTINLQLPSSKSICQGQSDNNSPVCF